MFCNLLQVCNHKQDMVSNLNNKTMPKINGLLNFSPVQGPTDCCLMITAANVCPVTA